MKELEGMKDEIKVERQEKKESVEVKEVKKEILELKAGQREEELIELMVGQREEEMAGWSKECSLFFGEIKKVGMKQTEEDLTSKVKREFE